MSSETRPRPTGICLAFLKWEILIFQMQKLPRLPQCSVLVLVEDLYFDCVYLLNSIIVWWPGYVIIIIIPTRSCIDDNIIALFIYIFCYKNKVLLWKCFRLAVSCVLLHLSVSCSRNPSEGGVLSLWVRDWTSCHPACRLPSLKSHQSAPAFFF